MSAGPLTPKQRYFNRVYRDAPWIKCACGCGKRIKSMDRYARPKKYVSGHNTPRKYDDPTQFKREWNHRNKSKRRKYKAEYHRSRKKKLVAIRGNKCEFCGYKYNGKNAAVFHFHHLRGKKSFNIGNQLVNYAWKEILRELRKCVMLCANCHEMQHTAEF